MDGARRRSLSILIAVFAIAVAGAGRLAVPAAAGEEQPVAAAPPAPPPVTPPVGAPPPPPPCTAAWGCPPPAPPPAGVIVGEAVRDPDDGKAACLHAATGEPLDLPP